MTHRSPSQLGGSPHFARILVLEASDRPSLPWGIWGRVGLWGAAGPEQVWAAGGRVRELQPGPGAGRGAGPTGWGARSCSVAVGTRGKLAFLPPCQGRPASQPVPRSWR